jgi:AraC family transcriptional regulator
VNHKTYSEPQLDRSHLKPLKAATFPCHLTVLTDKPRGLVAYENESGLVGFENTNVIIRSRGICNELPQHVGPLSLLFAVGGQDIYEVDGQRLIVDDSSYLIHNLGQVIGSSEDVVSPVDSFTIGFWPGFAEDVLRGLVTPDDQLLDRPAPSYRQQICFFDQLYPHDTILSPLLHRVCKAFEDPALTKGWLEEQHYQLLTAMLWVHRDIGRQIARLPAVRAVTRLELYRRLHRARDFMEAELDQPLTIGQIAQAAWFSPFHFLRQFKEAFGETPHQYLTRRRLERAQHLLQTTEMSVTDICFAVGFESLSSFSGLFRQRLGVSPQRFRQRA